MKPCKIAIALSLALLLAAAPAWAAEEEQPNVIQLIREFQGDAPERQRSAEEWEAAYAQVLFSILPRMAAERVESQREPQQMLQRMTFRASRPGAELQRAALAKVMADNVGVETPVAARVWLLRQIQQIGRAEVVPALAPILNDADPLVRETARRALAANPSRQAAEALRTALEGATDPKWRVALINAIAYRRDPAGAPLLRSLAGDRDEDVRIAAIEALADIADSASVKVIAGATESGSPRARAIALDAYVRLADAMAGRGDNTAALGVYRQLLSASGHVKCAALIGLGKTGGLAELGDAIAAVADQDPKVRGAAIEALGGMKGSDVTHALARRIGSEPVEQRAWLLRALAMRNDKSTMPVFVTAAESWDEASQVEAIGALATLGDASVVSLLARATTGNPKVQEAARLTLGRMSGRDVDAALLALVRNSPSDMRVELLRIFGVRRTEGAVPVLLDNAAHADGNVRMEAYKSLALLAGGDALERMVALLLKVDNDRERRELSEAIVQAARRVNDPNVSAAPALTALKSASGDARLALLGVLGRIGGSGALQAMRAALSENDEQVRDVAVRALADWADFEAADDLLALAKDAPSQTHQVLALRGYLRLVAATNARRAPAENLRMYRAAMEIARRNEERRMILSGLGDIRSADALVMILPFLKDENLREDAASAAVRVCRDTWQNNLEASRDALTLVLEVSQNEPTQRMAREVLTRVENRLKERQPAAPAQGG